MNINKVNLSNPSTKLKTPLTVHSIKIPLIRHQQGIQKQQEQQQQQSDLMNNQFESDLTELSWLTNNINMLTNTSSILTSTLSAPKTNLTITSSKTLSHRHQIEQDESSLSSLPLLSPDSPLSSSSSSTSSSSSSSSISPCLSPCSECNSSKENRAKSKKPSKKPKSAKKSDSSTNNQSTLQFSSQYKNTCGQNKPPLTLSCLIFMALEEANDKCLPVREIYEWIEENFPYYKTSENSGWKSSIRHNLSFSKCFIKMDRNESILCRPQTQDRKRRAPNTVGTCWKVNNECKGYLIQTLKKSTFWFNNSKYYSKLANFIDKFDLSEIKKNHHNHHHETSIKTTTSNKKLKVDVSSLNEDSLSDEVPEFNSNLLEFVQKQQEILVEHVNPSSASGACDKQDPLDLSLSASSSSLSSAFSSLSSKFKDDDRMKTANLSSDLEMEVASTLVDMKWFATRNKN